MELTEIQRQLLDENEAYWRHKTGGTAEGNEHSRQYDEVLKREQKGSMSRCLREIAVFIESGAQENDEEEDRPPHQMVVFAIGVMLRVDAIAVVIGRLAGDPPLQRRVAVALENLRRRFDYVASGISENLNRINGHDLPAFHGKTFEDAQLVCGDTLESLADEVAGFELIQENARPNVEPPGSKNPPAPEFSHNVDFTEVRWGSHVFHFSSGQQTAAIKVLWKEMEKGFGAKVTTIAQACDSANGKFRLDLVFRIQDKEGKKVQHPAWGTMIVSGGRGSFRLEKPIKNSESQV